MGLVRALVAALFLVLAAGCVQHATVSEPPVVLPKTLRLWFNNTGADPDVPTSNSDVEGKMAATDAQGHTLVDWAGTLKPGESAYRSTSLERLENYTARFDARGMFMGQPSGGSARATITINPKLCPSDVRIDITSRWAYETGLSSNGGGGGADVDCLDIQQG